MFMNRIICLAAVLITPGLSITHAAIQAEELTGREIAVMVEERPDGEDRQGTMRLTLINKKGKKRERVVASASKDYGKDRKTILFFEYPRDVKGTGFLQFEYDDPARDDDRWLYLPAMKRVRRISGSAKSDYFMGTDFTYDDLGDRNVDEDVHTLICEEKSAGQDCWVVESKPKEEGYVYSKKISWIRKDIHMPIKVEFYGRQETLIKTLTVSDIRRQNGIWTICKMIMENIERRHKTILEYEEVRYDQGIKDSLFRVPSLERGRL